MNVKDFILQYAKMLAGAAAVAIVQSANHLLAMLPTETPLTLGPDAVAWITGALVMLVVAWVGNKPKATVPK